MSSKYSLEEKRRTLKLAAEVGASEAARRLSIPSGTVTQWRWKARQAALKGNDWPERVSPRDDDSDESLKPSVAKKTSAAKKTSSRAARVYTPSQRAEALELADKVGVVAASAKLGMTRFSIYQWRRRAKLAAQGQAESVTSGPDPADVAATRDAEIVTMWREHPGLGPSQVRNQLRRKSIKVSTATVRRVMEEAGYRPPKARPPSRHDKRYEAVRPNHIWHFDFVQRWIGRVSTFTLIIIDDHSRFVVGHGVDDAERADIVIATFEGAVARYGRPEMVVHDKGSAFWSWKGIGRFTRLVGEMDIEQLPSSKPTAKWKPSMATSTRSFSIRSASSMSTR